MTRLFDPTFHDAPPAVDYESKELYGTDNFYPYHMQRRPWLREHLWPVMLVGLAVIAGAALMAWPVAAQQPQPLTKDMARIDCDSQYTDEFVDWPLIPGTNEMMDSFSLGDVMPDGTRYKRIKMTTVYKQKPECSLARMEKIQRMKIK